MSTSLPRTVQGKRPDFFETPGVDDALAMILVLAEEMAVLRERMDSAEIVSARRGIDLAREIEELTLDEATLTARESWRQGFYDRLFYLTKQRRTELELKHSAQSYSETIAEIAKG